MGNHGGCPYVASAPLPRPISDLGSWLLALDVLASLPMTRDELTGVAQAVAATACFSTGAILVRWAGELSPVEVTSLRMLLGAGFVGLAAWTAREPLRIPASEWVGAARARVTRLMTPRNAPVP